MSIKNKKKEQNENSYSREVCVIGVGDGEA